MYICLIPLFSKRIQSWLLVVFPFFAENAKLIQSNQMREKKEENWKDEGRKRGEKERKTFTAAAAKENMQF